MTLCMKEKILYVVLDFEGLGSFVRTEQEDMLLSVFNAAISGMTILRLGYQLDRNIQKMFGRFRAGVGLINGDDSLFRGSLCLAIKDVVESDIGSVVCEFHEEIERIVTPGRGGGGDADGARGEENFISALYGGEFTILPFPPLGEVGYYEELRNLSDELDMRRVIFKSGTEFVTCMKTVMAKILLKDWSTLAGHAKESRVEYLVEYLV